VRCPRRAEIGHWTPAGGANPAARQNLDPSELPRRATSAGRFLSVMPARSHLYRLTHIVLRYNMNAETYDHDNEKL
jgi:hypothetical protein